MLCQCRQQARNRKPLCILYITQYTSYVARRVPQKAWGGRGFGFVPSCGGGPRCSHALPYEPTLGSSLPESRTAGSMAEQQRSSLQGKETHLMTPAAGRMLRPMHLGTRVSREMLSSNFEKPVISQELCPVRRGCHLKWCCRWLQESYFGQCTGPLTLARHLSCQREPAGAEKDLSCEALPTVRPAMAEGASHKRPTATR